jgi:hypothetical protein
VIFEQPLERWGDVAGSKVRPRDFFKAIYELVTIYRTYLRGAKHESKNGVGQAVLVQPEADARATAGAPAAIAERIRNQAANSV